MNKFAYQKKIEWTTKSGSTATVEITLQVREDVDADGDTCEVDCFRFSTTARVGRNVAGYGGLVRKSVNFGGTLYPAHIGKLLIPAEQLAEIDAAIAEAEATPEYQAHQRAEERRAAADEKYEAEAAKMRNRMRECC